MKKTRRILIPLVLLMTASVLLNSCMSVPSKEKGGVGSALGGKPTVQVAPSGPAVPSEPSAPSEPEFSMLSPQEALIEGAKTMLSTNFDSLLTEKTDGAYLLGLNSEFWNDVNSSSNETSLTATVGEIVMDGEISDEGLNLELELVHNAASGDSSIEAAVGLGSDTNLSGGLFVKDGVGIFKPASTDQDIVLYTLPEHGDTTLLGTFGAMFTGLLSDDGTATDVSENQSDREALAAEVLDPWLTSTSPEDYEEMTDSFNLLGEDVECRVIELYLDGQEAYDFAMDNITMLDKNDLLSGANSVLGLGMFSSLDSLDSLDEFDSDSLTSDDATAQIIDELEAMTQEEIDEMSFWFDVIFNGDKAVGIDCYISTMETAMSLDIIACREGPENQFEVSFYKDDASFDFEVSKISAGGSTYDEDIDFNIYDDAGEEVLSGWYTGTVDETETSLEREGFLSLDLELSISDDAQMLTVDANLTSSLSKTDTGYSGDGQVYVDLYVGESLLSMTVSWRADMEKSDDAAVMPPIYTDSNSVMVSDLESLSEAVGLDYSEVAGQSSVVQLMYIIGSLVTSDLGNDFGF